MIPFFHGKTEMPFKIKPKHATKGILMCTTRRLKHESQFTDSVMVFLEASLLNDFFLVSVHCW